MELPEEFLKRWLHATNKELTEQQIDKDFDSFMRDLRWQLIKDRIIAEQQINVQEDEAQILAHQIAYQQFSQYGIFNPQNDHVHNYAVKILENEKERERIYRKLYEDKVIASVKSNVRLQEKAVTQDEFNQLLEKK